MKTLTFNEREWRLVPNKPAPAMLNAAIDVDSFKLGDISPLGFRMSPQMLFEKCWAAMLSAAPQPEPVETKLNDAPWVIRKSGAFYRPNRAGYTIHIEAAGLYTREEAETEARVEPHTMSAHPLKEFVSTIRHSFDLAANLLKLLGEDPDAAAVRAENEACVACVEKVAGLRFKQGELSENGQAVLNYIIPHIAQAIRARQEGK